MKEQIDNHRCVCGGALETIDKYSQSFTRQCNVCRRCVLIVRHSGLNLCVPLTDFHLKRGDGPGRRPISDLGMATELVECLSRDRWPRPAAVLDFGIDTPEHLGALQYAVRGGVSAYDLDRAMGDGPALTALVKSVPVQPYPVVRFETVYDTLSLHADERKGQF